MNYCRQGLAQFPQDSYEFMMCVGGNKKDCVVNRIICAYGASTESSLSESSFPDGVKSISSSVRSKVQNLSKIVYRMAYSFFNSLAYLHNIKEFYG